jgi:hypothetical protein
MNTSGRFCRFLEAVTFMILTIVSVSAVNGQPTPTPLGSADKQMQAVGEAVLSVRQEAPQLIGFKDHDSIRANAFAGRSTADVDMLVGRIYLDSVTELTARGGVDGAGKPTPAAELRTAIHQALSIHRPVARYSRMYFDELLKETSARAARDPVFRGQIRESSSRARTLWIHVTLETGCIVDGVQAPLWLCLHLLANDMVVAIVTIHG